MLDPERNTNNQNSWVDQARTPDKPALVYYLPPSRPPISQLAANIMAPFDPEQIKRHIPGGQQAKTITPATLDRDYFEHPQDPNILVPLRKAS